MMRRNTPRPFFMGEEQSIHLEKNKPERSIMANKNTSDSIEAYNNISVIRAI